MSEPSATVISTLQLLARYGNGRPAANALEGAVAQALQTEVNSRETVQRFIKRWTEPKKEPRTSHAKLREAISRDEPLTDIQLRERLHPVLTRPLKPFGPGIRMVSDPPRGTGTEIPPLKVMSGAAPSGANLP